MASVFKYGLMVPNTRATGKITWLTVEASTTMPMVTSMMVSDLEEGSFMTIGNWENDKANGYGVYI